MQAWSVGQAKSQEVTSPFFSTDQRGLVVSVLVEGADSSSVDCHGYDYVDRFFVCSGDHESDQESLGGLY